MTSRDDFDHPHGRRIDQHDTIPSHGIFDAFCLRRSGESVVRQKVELCNRRNLRADRRRNIVRSAHFRAGSAHGIAYLGPLLRRELKLRGRGYGASACINVAAGDLRRGLPDEHSAIHSSANLPD